MVNIAKLRGKIVESNMNIEKIAGIVGIDKSTMYRKLEPTGEKITIREATLISHALGLTFDEVNSIFFDQYVAQNAN